MPLGSAASGDPGRELGDRARRRDPPDPVAAVLGEPEVAVGPGRDAQRVDCRGDAGRELGHRARRRDPPDPIAAVLGEPQVAVGPGRDAAGFAPAVIPVENSVTVPVGVIRPIRSPLELGEPEVAVGPRRDVPRAERRRVIPAENSVTAPARRDPSDPVAEEFGEPQVAVHRAYRDACGKAAPGDPGPEPRHGAHRRDPSDPVAVRFGEPDVVDPRACRDSHEKRLSRGTHRKLGDAHRRGHRWAREHDACTQDCRACSRSRPPRESAPHQLTTIDAWPITVGALCLRGRSSVRR